MKPLAATFLISTIAMTPQVQSKMYVTPFVGFTVGGEVVDQDGTEYDLEGSESFAISVETTLEQGRIGFFYATQNSDFERVNEESSLHYLHFQSSIYYPAADTVSTYLGVGLGGSYTDVDWADDKYGFSASIFGGVEFDVTDNLALTSQFRWLGTSVDNETTTICNLPSPDTCTIRFKTDWINQFSANLGLVMRF